MTVKINTLTKQDIAPIIKDSFALMIRRPIAFIVFCGLSLVLYYAVIQFFEPIGYLALIIPILIGSTIAKAADDQESVMVLIRKTHVQALKNACICYLLVCALYTAISLLMEAAFFLITGEFNPSSERVDHRSQWLIYSANTYGYFGLMIGYGLLIWPCSSLLALYKNFPLDMCIRASRMAFFQSRHALLALGLTPLIIGLFMHFFGALYFLAAPFICSLNYVIYRSLFTDQKRNKKVEQKVSVQIPVVSS